jgi:hypothetical protein
MKVEKVIHRQWEALDQLKKKGVILEPLFAKWQYLYSSDKGEISLIELVDCVISNKWEIMELSKNNLFECIERYPTKEDAEKRIKELLE